MASTGTPGSTAASASDPYEQDADTERAGMSRALVQLERDEGARHDQAPVLAPALPEHQADAFGEEERRVDEQAGADRRHPPPIERGDRVDGTAEMPPVRIDVHLRGEPRQLGRDVARGPVKQAERQRGDQQALRELEDADDDQGRRLAPPYQRMDPPTPFLTATTRARHTWLGAVTFLPKRARRGGDLGSRGV
jgi:hypothetical protein